MERRNICLTLAFDGTNYAGWQRQEDEVTVQGTLEAALRQLTGEASHVTGSSRTDAGVHARGFVANFYTRSTIPPKRWLYPLNNILPEDIRVLSSCEVEENFHAQRDALAKTYVYRFHNLPYDLVLDRHYVAQEKGPMDDEAMMACAKLFCGEHDFGAFRSTGSSAKTTRRTLFQSSLSKSGDRYTYQVTGNGFLYNMVRILVGTLFYVAHGTRSLEEVTKALEGQDRLLAGKVAPAKGLCLEKVWYDEDELRDFLDQQR